MLLNIPKAAPAARIIQPQMKGGGTEAHGYQGPIETVGAAFLAQPGGGRAERACLLN